MRKERKSTKKIKRRREEGPLPVSELISQGDAAIESLDITKALEFFQAALPMLDDDEPQLASVLTKMGEAKVSIGDQEGAREDFEKAIRLTKEGNKKAALYLYLGQLSTEDEALEAYEKGIQELEIYIQSWRENDEQVANQSDLAKMGQEEKLSLGELTQQLVRAHCTVAELYLTDLCFAEQAEQECERHVDMAMKLTPEPLMDALQVMTSLRLSQQKEASDIILQCYQQMRTGCEALATLVGLKERGENERNGAVELREVEAADSLPGFEFRCQTAKLLLECASNSMEESKKVECVQAAIQVLGSLIAENDDVVEIWYLLGCAFELDRESEAGLACYYWHHALRMLEKVKQDLKQQDEDDDEVIEELNMCEDQIQDIKNKLDRVSQEMAGAENGVGTEDLMQEES
jgi:tetratricopeptide (TPR) repeat protein